MNIFMAIAFALCAVIIIFALTNYAGKQFDSGNTVAGVTFVCLTLLFFFGSFVFAKFVFGF